jgi:hypothetical protein
MGSIFMAEATMERLYLIMQERVDGEDGDDVGARMELQQTQTLFIKVNKTIDAATLFAPLPSLSPPARKGLPRSTPLLNSIAPSSRRPLRAT